MIPKPSGSTVLYHITVADNVPGIQLEGIEPSYSKGRLKASWYVSKRNILWALAHCSARHKVPVSDLYVCAVLVEWDMMKRSNRQGIYFTYFNNPPESVSPAGFFVDTDSLEE